MLPALARPLAHCATSTAWLAAAPAAHNATQASRAAAAARAATPGAAAPPRHSMSTVGGGKFPPEMVEGGDKIYDDGTIHDQEHNVIENAPPINADPKHAESGKEAQEAIPPHARDPQDSRVQADHKKGPIQEAVKEGASRVKEYLKGNI